MKQTCVSIDCPFILYCKHYNCGIDRTGGCKTQENILTLAKRLEKQRKAAERATKKDSKA